MTEVLTRGVTARVASWLGALALLLAAGTAAPADDREDLVAESWAAVAAFQKAEPKLRAFFDKAHAYAVFPSVTKIAYVYGLAGGEGVVFEGGGVTGFSTLKQVTMGFQAGVHHFREVIFFRDADALEDFKQGHFEFDAEASAAAGKAGVSEVLDFDKDVLVFVMTRGGLFFDASLGGQKFSFTDKEHGE
mgnify:CR=1 FL=1